MPAMGGAATGGTSSSTTPATAGTAATGSTASNCDTKGACLLLPSDPWQCVCSDGFRLDESSWGECRYSGLVTICQVGGCTQCAANCLKNAGPTASYYYRCVKQ
jgi:hypothetical protein